MQLHRSLRIAGHGEREKFVGVGSSPQNFRCARLDDGTVTGELGVIARFAGRTTGVLLSYQHLILSLRES